MIEATTKVIASTPNATHSPTSSVMPPMNGPMSREMDSAELIRANACISRDGGMIVANIELSAPSWKARNAPRQKASARIVHSFQLSEYAMTERARSMVARVASDQNITVRESDRSATIPRNDPSSTPDRISIMSTKPTSTDDRLIVYAAIGRATSVNESPIVETVRPSQ